MEIENHKQKFILLEEETSFDMCEHDSENCFARDRIIRLILDVETAKDLKKTLLYFDDLLLQAVRNQHAERWVRCKQCKEENETGYFFAKKGFQPDNEMDMCENIQAEHDRAEHEWDGRFLELETKRSLSSSSTSTQACSESLPTEERTNDGFNFALVICNDKYQGAKGFKDLKSARMDFQGIVETLANDHKYDFSVMERRRKKEGVTYNAGSGSDFEKRVTENGYINTEDVLEAVSSYVSDLKGLMKDKRRTKIDTFFFHFLGHGINSQGQDCLIGANGKATSIKSLQKEIESLNADKNFLVIEACRDKAKATQYQFKEDDNDYEPPLDKKFVIVYAAPRGWVTPDVPGKTMTCCLVEHLQTKKFIKVKDLPQTLKIIWDTKQDQVEYYPDVDINPASWDIEFP